MNKQKVVPGALTALAVGTIVHRARRERTHARAHGLRRFAGRRH